MAANGDLEVTGRALFANTWAEELRLSEDRYDFGLPLAPDAFNDPFLSTLTKPRGCALFGSSFPECSLPANGLPGGCMLPAGRHLPLGKSLASAVDGDWSSRLGVLTEGAASTRLLRTES